MKDGFTIWLGMIAIGSIFFILIIFGLEAQHKDFVMKCTEAGGVTVSTRGTDTCFRKDAVIATQ